MRQRRGSVLEKEMPYLVAEINGEVVGYAYVTPYRPRPAYRHTVEDSVYVKAGRAGLGTALCRALVRAAWPHAAAPAGRRQRYWRGLRRPAGHAAGSAARTAAADPPCARGCNVGRAGGDRPAAPAQPARDDVGVVAPAGHPQCDAACSDRRGW
ncbi:hypothetical protein G6F55_013758 [Rhizopus delemar]|nr:hypothetical protein G6F55_013758 [Rhizopus delemar]